MIWDSHLHTEFSFDSAMTLQEAQAAAEEREVCLILTEHVDLYTTGQTFDPRAYRRAYEAHRGEGLLLGTECGMDPRTAQPSLEFLKQAAPDFWLGSVHTVAGHDIYNRNTYKVYSRQEFWPAYFQFMIECLKTHPYIHSLAHVDFPARLSPYVDGSFDYEDHRDYLDQIFRILIDQDISLEWNMRRYQAESRDEFIKLFTAFYDLGGRHVTLGSDAHTPHRVGQGLKEVSQIVKKIGLDLVHYKEGRRIIDN